MLYRVVVYFHRYTLFGGYTGFKRRGQIRAESEEAARKLLHERANKLAEFWDRNAYYRNKQSTTVGYIEVKEEN